MATQDEGGCGNGDFGGWWECELSDQEFDELMLFVEAKKACGEPIPLNDKANAQSVNSLSDFYQKRDAMRQWLQTHCTKPYQQIQDKYAKQGDEWGKRFWVFWIRKKRKATQKSKNTMNVWTKKSIELANQSNYLDLLYKIYPMSVNLRRELDISTKNQIKNHLKNKDGKKLLEILFKQEVFPIKDSYVAYLKRDKTAIARNPNTVDRLSGMLIEMGYDEIIEKTTAPKETNRQIGPLFKNWLVSGALGVFVTDNPQEFLDFSGNAIFNASDSAMKTFASEYLGYTHNKGLDFIGKFNDTFIIGEAKFLTDFGGHQNAQFNDAIATMQAKLNPTNYKVKTIAVLDGVLYISGKNKMYAQLLNFCDDSLIVSSVLLRDYLFSV